MEFFTQLFQNKVLVSAAIGWFLAQGIKVILSLIYDDKFDFTRISGCGGMPSSHTAFVSAAAVSTGLTEGFSSAAFALSIVFLFVVMTDAAGVRRAAGKQAAVLNDILDNVVHNKGVPPTKLKELLGHTPLEVIAGLMLGIAVGIIYFLLF